MALTAKQLNARYHDAVSDRGTSESHWQEVAWLVLPSRQFTTKLTPGQKLHRQIFDDTAPQANEDFAGWMHGLNTNPAIRWYNLAPEDFDFQRMTDEEAVWLYDQTTKMLSYFASPASGFPTASHEMYLDIGAFGNAPATMLEKNGWLKFQARQLASTYWVENDEGDVIEIYRRSELTPRKMAQRFELSALDKDMAESAKKDAQADTVCVIQAVYFAPDADIEDPTFRGMPWQSRHWILDKVDNDKFLRESGFRDNPYLTPRWSKAAEEVYGRGPAMKVLPAIKVANAIARTNLIAGEQVVRPPIYIPANSVQGNITTNPGSFWYGRTGKGDKPEPVNLGTRPDIGMTMLERVQAQIKAGFFTDKLTLPDAGDGRGHPRMTREEVLQRRDQSFIIASPATSRIQGEFLDRAISTVFNWMMRTGRFNPVPQSLRGRALRPFYTSPLAQSQRASEVDGVTQALITAEPLLASDQTLMANVVNAEATLRGIWSMLNAPPSFLRSRDESAQLAEQQEQVQELATTGQIAESFAGAAKDAASAA